MTSINLPDIPFAGRFPAKLEALSIDDLGDRLPEGPGDALLIYEEAIPYLYLPNEDASDWLKFALIDVTDEPDDGTVLTWDTATHTASFETPSGGVGGGSVSTAKMTKSGDTVIATGAGLQPVPWDIINFDTADVFAFDALYSDNVFEAPATGVYQHTINLAVSADAANRLVTIQLLDETAGIYAQAKYLIGTTETHINFSALTEIAVGKILQVYMSVSAGSMTVSGFVYGEWSVLKLS